MRSEARKGSKSAPAHDDGDSQEESETSEMSGTSSEKRRLDSTREELREASQEALRMAARKFGPEERDLDAGDYMATGTAEQAAQAVERRRREQCGSWHPSVIRSFVFDWLGFDSVVLRLCTEERNAPLGKSIMVSNLFNQVTTETTHCAYAAYTGAPL
jgi:hypothetical protein